MLIQIVSIACTGKAIKEKTNNIQHIIGTVISLPSSPKWSIMGRDTTITFTKYPKLIVYFNSRTCMPCALKELKHWNPVIQHILSLRNEGVFIETIFILQAEKQNKKVRDAIISQRFKIPIIYDERGEFEEQNILPDNDLMHAIFVDADNKVIFVGNPLLSKKHEKVFYSLFAGFGKSQPKSKTI